MNYAAQMERGSCSRLGSAPGTYGAVLLFRSGCSVGQLFADVIAGQAYVVILCWPRVRGDLPQLDIPVYSEDPLAPCARGFA